MRIESILVIWICASAAVVLGSLNIVRMATISNVHAYACIKEKSVRAAGKIAHTALLAHGYAGDIDGALLDQLFRNDLTTAGDVTRIHTKTISGLGRGTNIDLQDGFRVHYYENFYKYRGKITRHGHLLATFESDSQ